MDEMIRVELDGMYRDYFEFEDVEKFAEAAVFFVRNGKSFRVSFTEEDEDDETRDQ